MRDFVDLYRLLPVDKCRRLYASIADKLYSTKSRIEKIKMMCISGCRKQTICAMGVERWRASSGLRYGADNHLGNLSENDCPSCIIVTTSCRFIIKTSYYPLIRFHFLHKNQCRTIYLINTIEQILKFSICCKERMIYMITALKSSIGNGLRRAVTSITLPKINISALCFRSTCIKAFHDESELMMSIVVYMIPTCRWFNCKNDFLNCH